MSVKALSHVWEHSSQRGPRLLVLLAIADSANDDGFCWMALAKLAKKARQDRANTQRYVQEIAAAGEVVIYDRKADDGSINLSNIYKVVMPGTKADLPDLKGKITRRGGSRKSTTTHRKTTTGDSRKTTMGVVVESRSNPLHDPSTDSEKIVPDGTSSQEVIWLPGNHEAFETAQSPQLYPCSPADINALIAAWWEWVPRRPAHRGKVVSAKNHFANRENRTYAENLVQRGVMPADFARFLGEVRADTSPRWKYLREKELTFCYVAPMVEEWVAEDRAENWYTAVSPRVTPRRPDVTIDVGLIDGLSEDDPDFYVDVPRPYITPHEAADLALDDTSTPETSDDDALLKELDMTL